MTNIFGLPIIAAVVLGIFFPYFALTLIPLAFVFLFLLMILAGLTIKWSLLKTTFHQSFKILSGLVFLFFIFPLLQYGLAKVLIRDIQFLYGLVFASLTPVAMVAPYFTSVVKGDERLSFLLLVTSMLLCPFIAPPVLKLFFGHHIAIQTWPLFKYMLLLITLPLMISYWVSKYLPSVTQRLIPHLGLLNMVILSILIYILWGNTAGRINLSYTVTMDIIFILGLVLFQDFGVLFISRWLCFKRYRNKAEARAFSISFSMKNVAVAAGLLLFYDPRAALPPAMAFIAHALLFNFIPFFRKKL
jgi:predicted Na+-dependent transporter